MLDKETREDFEKRGLLTDKTFKVEALLLRDMGEDECDTEESIITDVTVRCLKGNTGRTACLMLIHEKLAEMFTKGDVRTRGFHWIDDEDND
ncbi:MAG: hypothetical protein SLAVMIC_00739 [uncultured marine phage]|uniref:Uncharacterized protein n=1 Tax=uncultured marine phage TaxID=707152 RepID=A0A8D9CAJ0_9VIRU|nr:MAG: hypothetical protein SLAVMIC_00739 [uncultured marine phage]